jgi:hypothetical protein
MRLRTAQDRLKVEHSIIDGVRGILESLLAANPEIRSVIPGVIRPVRDAKGKVRMRITVPTQNGWKATLREAGPRLQFVPGEELVQPQIVDSLRDREETLSRNMAFNLRQTSPLGGGPGVAAANLRERDFAGASPKSEFCTSGA